MVTAEFCLSVGCSNLLSGKILLKNTNPNKNIKPIEINPKLIDKDHKKHGVSEITIDTGAGRTLIPEELANSLGIPKPDKQDDSYYIFCGVGSIGTEYISSEYIEIILVDDKNNPVKNTITPACLAKCAPVVTSEKNYLLSLQDTPPFFTESIIPWISPVSNQINNYRVMIDSPNGNCIHPKINPPRRLKLSVHVGEDIDYILLGRDWQEAFEMTFLKDILIITQ